MFAPCADPSDERCVCVCVRLIRGCPRLITQHSRSASADRTCKNLLRERRSNTGQARPPPSAAPLKWPHRHPRAPATAPGGCTRELPERSLENHSHGRPSRRRRSGASTAISVFVCLHLGHLALWRFLPICSRGGCGVRVRSPRTRSRWRSVDSYRLRAARGAGKIILVLCWNYWGVSGWPHSEGIWVTAGYERNHSRHSSTFSMAMVRQAFASSGGPPLKQCIAAKCPQLRCGAMSSPRLPQGRVAFSC